jgi:hypothetical protein
VLFEFGANHACDPVITRVNPNLTRRTQVLVCRKTDVAIPEGWGLPGGRATDSSFKHPERMKLPEFLCTIVIHNIRKLQKEGKSINEQCFGVDKALADNSVPSEEEWLRRFESFLNSPTSPVYKGYCDDPRNTDDAWMETSVYHTHLPDYLGRLLDISDDTSFWQPTAESPPFRFRWIDVDSGVADYRRLYASHFDFVELCVPYCACGRRKYDQNDNSHSRRPAPELEKPTGACVAYESMQPSRGTEHVQQSQHLDAETSNLEAGSRTGGMCGEIQFLGNGTRSYYVRARIDKNEDVMHALQLLEMNGLRSPDFLISVTGGAQDFVMDGPRVDSIFSGIVQAAVTTGACIIDGGTDTGVMKLLGEAVVRGGSSVDLIGLTGWGSVIGRECIDKGACDKVFYSKTHANWHGEAGLDPNHSHFLLFDNGTAGSFGTEIETRKKLESALGDRKEFDGFKATVEKAYELDKCLYSQDNDTEQFLDFEVTDQFLNFRKCLCESLDCDLIELLMDEQRNREKTKKRKWGVNDLIRLHKYAASIQVDGRGDMKLCRAIEAILENILQKTAARPKKSLVKPEEDIVAIRRYLGRDIQKKDKEKKSDVNCDKFKVQAGWGSEEEDHKVPHCGKCEGLYHENYLPIAFRNAIPRTEYDEWFRIQEQLDVVTMKRSTLPETKSITCIKCKASLSIEDVKAEKFYQCKSPECDHYFFRSRFIEMRRRSRDHIICDGCHSRNKVEAVLGKFVPAVLVVVEGGKGTIHTVASTNAAFENQSEMSETMLQSKEQCTPILVVDGSGRAADFIASTWRHMHEGEQRCHGYKLSSCIASVRKFEESLGKSCPFADRSNRLLEASCPFVDAEYRRIFGEGIPEKERKLHVSWVIETCRRKEAVTIYNPFESSKGMDFAIMRAICKGTLCDGHPLSMGEQFRLAVNWNLADKQVTDLFLSSHSANSVYLCSLPLRFSSAISACAGDSRTRSPAGNNRRPRRRHLPRCTNSPCSGALLRSEEQQLAVGPALARIWRFFAESGC